MIIRNIGFLVCMLVVCSLNINTAMAQSRSYEGGITVNPVRLEQKGDFICLLYTSPSPRDTR